MNTERYRRNLQAILEFSGGRHLLSYRDVSKFTGYKDCRTMRRRFKFVEGHITAADLAAALAEEEEK